MLRVILAATLIFGLASCRIYFFRFGGGYDYLQKAEELTRQQKYDEAIEAYRKHIDSRLKIDKRPAWENPYFYLLLIGDLHLEKNQPDEAIKAYKEAEEQGIHVSFISDRIRSVATWYEKQGRYEDALDLLNQYRDRDPMLFEAMLDRIAKEMVRKEDSKRR